MQKYKQRKQSSVTLITKRKKRANSFGLALKIILIGLDNYAIQFFISSSTVDIPPMPKFLTKTSTTFGERKAGSVGPK